MIYADIIVCNSLDRANDTFVETIKQVKVFYNIKRALQLVHSMIR